MNRWVYFIHVPLMHARGWRARARYWRVGAGGPACDGWREARADFQGEKLNGVVSKVLWAMTVGKKDNRR